MANLPSKPYPTLRPWMNNPFPDGISFSWQGRDRVTT